MAAADSHLSVAVNYRSLCLKLMTEADLEPGLDDGKLEST